MKKLISIILLMGLCTTIGATNFGKSETSSRTNSLFFTAKGYSLPGVFWGQIGGYEAYMKVNNGKGTVEIIGSGTRYVRVKSYSGNTLILNAYSGKNVYLGYYTGTVRYDRGMGQTFYSGKFHNVNGHSVDFILHNNLD